MQQTFFAPALDEQSWQLLPLAERCACGEGCGWHGAVSDLQPLHDAAHRLAAGDTVPPGQCPACGAFPYQGDCEAAVARPVPSPRVEKVKNSVRFGDYSSE